MYYQGLENFSNLFMDWPMLYTGNPYVIEPGNVFFLHMILMDSTNNLAMNLGETYLVTQNGNERLGKQTMDLVVLQPVCTRLVLVLTK